MVSLDKLKEIVSKNPNDQDLGKKIRNLINNIKQVKDGETREENS